MNINSILFEVFDRKSVFVM